MLVKLVQFEKAPPSIFVIVDGRLTEARFVQLLNIDAPTTVTPSLITTLVKALQFSNATLPIDLTLEGISMLVSEVQRWNIPSLITSI